MPPINNIRTSSPTPDVLNVSDISVSSVGNDEPHHPLRKSLFHWMNEAAKRSSNLKARNHHQNSPAGAASPPVYQKPKSLSYNNDNDTSGEGSTSMPLLASWNPTTAYSDVLASFEKSFEELLASRPAQSMPMPTPPTSGSSSSPSPIYSNPTDEVDDGPPISPLKQKKDDSSGDIYFETNFSSSSPPLDVLPESCQEDIPSFESASPIKLDSSLEEPIIDNKETSIEDEEFDDLMRVLQKDFEDETSKDDAIQQQEEDLEYLKLMRDFEEEMEALDLDDLQSDATEASSPMDTETFQQLRDAFQTYSAARGKKVEFREDIDVRFFQRTSSEKRSLFRKFRRRARRRANANVRNNRGPAGPGTSSDSKDSSNLLPDPITDVVRIVQTKFHELEEAGVEWKKKFKSWTDMNLLEALPSNMICVSSNQSIDESNKNNGVNEEKKLSTTIDGSNKTNSNVEMNQQQKLAALADLVESMEPGTASGEEATVPIANTAADADTANNDDSFEENAKARWPGLVKALERKTSPKKTHRRRPSADRDRKRNVVDGAKRWAAAQKYPASIATTETTTPSTGSNLVPRDIFVRSPSNNAAKRLQQPRLDDDASQKSSLLRMRLEREEGRDIARAKQEAQNYGKKQHKRCSSSVSPVSVAHF